MAAVRRSTRLSSISKELGTPRRSEIWRRKVEYCPADSDEEELPAAVVISDSDEENNENANVMNDLRKCRMNGDKLIISRVSGTPRTQRIFSKKTERRASSVKRKPAESDEESKAPQEELLQVSPPKHSRRGRPSQAQHLISPSRLLDRLSIDERKENDDCDEVPQRKEPALPKLDKLTQYQNARQIFNSETKDRLRIEKEKEISKKESKRKEETVLPLVEPLEKQPKARHSFQPQTMERKDEGDLKQKGPKKDAPPPKMETPQKSQIPRRTITNSATKKPKAKEPKEKIDEEVEGEIELPKPSKLESLNKYQNARRVLNSGATDKLPGREQQLEELRAYFTEHLSEQRSGSLYVSGQPGTGKTACLSLLLHSPEIAERLKCVYINCTSISSVGSVYKKICAELNLTPSGRTERDYLAAIQKRLKSASRMVLIVLDEIDQLCSSRHSVLYTIFEWPGMPGARILLVGIANSLDLTDRTLMRLNARCDLKPRLMHFPPYTKMQIVEIFKSRLETAGVLDVFPPVTLQLLAAKVSAVSGDVRRALDIGRHVVEMADQQRSKGHGSIDLNDLNFDQAIGEQSDAQTMEEEPMKPVQVTQVAEVLKKVYGASQNLQDDIEDCFPLQQKLMLCTLILVLRNDRNRDITMGRLHHVYQRVCTKRNIHALDQAEFAGVVSLVETRGILRIIRKKEPRLSKIQLQWDEGEVSDALRDKQLIASILDDASCLGK